MDEMIGGEVFGVGLVGSGEGSQVGDGRNVESGGLVRIFAIAEFLLAAKCKVEALWENWFFGERDLIGGDGETLEFGGDHAVVAGRGGEDFAGQVEASGQRCFS